MGGKVQHNKGKIRDNALKALVKSDLFRHKVERKRKGKGSYNRQEAKKWRDGLILSRRFDTLNMETFAAAAGVFDIGVFKFETLLQTLLWCNRLACRPHKPGFSDRYKCSAPCPSKIRSSPSASSTNSRLYAIPEQPLVFTPKRTHQAFAAFGRDSH